MMRDTSAPGAFPDAKLALYRSAWDRDGAYGKMVNWYRAAFRRGHAEGPLRRVAVPTLVVAAAHDAFIPGDLTRASVELLDDGRLLELDYGTHWVLQEEPEKTAQIVADFCAGSGASRSRLRGRGLLRLRALRVALRDELVGDVVLVDVRDVVDRLAADLARRRRPRRCRTTCSDRAPAAAACLRSWAIRAGPALYAANAKSVRFGPSKWASGKYCSIRWRMYFAPAWMFASAWWMSPTPICLPVAGMSCITPTAPTWLFRFWSRRDSW